MKKKILVADDSPTIQKVINITLANSAYKVDSALNDAELLLKLRGDDFSLLLLDFNLSEDRDGYELAKEIHSLSPATKIMAMLGTFDKVEDSKFKEAGFSDRIIKPFESSKFIVKIDSLLGGDDEADEAEEGIDDIIFPSHSFEEEVSLGEDEDFFPHEGKEDISHEGDISSYELDSEDWVMESPGMVETEVTEVMEFDQGGDIKKLNPSLDFSSNSLQEEVADWGMGIPDVIGGSPSLSSGEDISSLFPPQISPPRKKILKKSLEESLDLSISKKEEEGNLSSEHARDLNKKGDKVDKIQSEQLFPESEDLSYPAALTEEEEGQEKEEGEKRRTPELDSLSDFDFDSSEGTNIEINIAPEEDSPDLINELNADISPDEFWAADQELLEQKVEGENKEEEEDREENREENKETTNLLEKEVPQGQDQKEEALRDQSPKNELEEVEPASRELSGRSIKEEEKREIVDSIKRELLEELKPMVSKMVEEAVSQFDGTETAEKIAWEVIPDLAENLIKKEVSDISKKILDKHSLS